MSGCPDAERLAAYLDGQLFPEQRDRLEEHLAGCAECASAIAEALRFQCATTSMPAQTSGGRLAAAAAIAVAGLGAALALASGAGRAPWQSEPRAPLIAATESAPAMAPRLTGGVRFAPRPDTMRGGTMPAGSAQWDYYADYYAAASEVRRRAVRSPSGDRLGALGDAHLLVGDFDRALLTLARATAADPGNARLESDLGAAYLARGLHTGNAADFAECYEATSRALALDPDLREARFNRALALEGLQLRLEARAEWQEYLRHEDTPVWADEARHHLTAIDAALAAATPMSPDVLRGAAERDAPELSGLVAAHRFAARRMIERAMLPEWAAATLGGRASDASRSLEAAAAIARHYTGHTGERRVTDEVAEAAAARGDGARRLAHAWIAIERAALSLQGNDYADAGPELDRALSLLPANSAARPPASIERLVATLATRGASEELSNALRLRAEATGDDLATHLRVLWIQGVALMQGRDAAAAIAPLSDALALSERLRETELTAFLHLLLSQAYAFTGNQRVSWEHRTTALAKVPQLEDWKRGYGILTGSGATSLVDGQPWLADATFDELSRSRFPEGAYEKVESGLWRARVRYALGDVDAARDQLTRGTGSLLAVAPGVPRQRLLAELRATQAATGAPPRLAIRQLSRALDAYRALNVLWRVPGILLQRAIAFRAVGDSAHAEADLREAIALLQAKPAGDARRELWLTPLEGTSSLYDQLVSLELARGNEEEAFRWVERSHERARSFAAETPPAAPAPGFAELARQIDPGTVLLAYALLPERAVAWRIDSRGGRLIELGATSKEIETWSRALDADLAAGEWTSSTARAARRLHRALIAPAGLDADDRLVVVPDKELAGVPFAALIGDGGRFELEQRVTEVSTSARSYLASRVRWLELDGEAASAFVIGDPIVDARVFPGLSRLPGAGEEARRVAALYPGSTLATGASATRRALLEAMGNHAVVHIAAHALVDDSNPQHSALALAPASREESGALFAEDISQLALSRTRTIVLAACGSSGGPTTRAEARMSLATAFLSADVPTVVGALWPVSDRRSVELLTGLHSRLRAGDDPAAALRSAQLGLLSSADPALRSPATWALFQALGG